MRTATCLADRIRPECLFDTTTLTRAGESPRGKESDLRDLRYLFPLRLIFRSNPIPFCSVRAHAFFSRRSPLSRHGMTRRGTDVARLRADQTPNPLLLEDVRAPP